MAVQSSNESAGTVITIATSKGGAGKTTLSRLILGLLSVGGMSVAAIDADFNTSLFNWVTRIAKLPIPIRSELDETKIVSLVSELQENNDVVVIDTAGAATQATIFAIGCADLVLIPVKPGSDDVVEAIKTYRLIESAAQMMKRPIPIGVVMIGFKPGTVIEEHIAKQLAEAKLPVLKARLSDLVAFSEMSLTGHVPTAGAAGLQAVALLEEINARGGLPRTSPMQKIA